MHAHVGFELWALGFFFGSDPESWEGANLPDHCVMVGGPTGHILHVIYFLFSVLNREEKKTEKTQGVVVRRISLCVLSSLCSCVLHLLQLDSNREWKYATIRTYDKGDDCLLK